MVISGMMIANVRGMKCPLLEEIVVSYCKACPVKKMIPSEGPQGKSPCVADYSECPAYMEFARKPGREVEMAQLPVEKKQECIWMKAGVIAYRLCTSDYDCKSCEFDQSLMDQGEAYGGSPMVVEAIAKLRTMPAEKRKCRYMLTNDLSFKLCSNNYECWHCATDQLVQDMIEANPFLQKKRARVEARKVEKVKGFCFRDDVYYHPAHSWLKVEKDGLVRIGFDDFAHRVLGPLSAVRLPEAGRPLTDVEVRTGNRRITLRLPLRGKVVEVNQSVLDSPESAGQDPYGRGWLLRLQPTDSTELGKLMRGSDARKWLEDDWDKLSHTLQSEAGVTVADGGELIPELHKRVSDEEWLSLVERFLKRK